jgi:hypothetical protein
LALRDEGNPEDFIVANIPEKNEGRIQRRKHIFGKEFKLNTHTDDYEIRDVMSDFGFDVNKLSNKTWEAMGKPKIIYSPIQLQIVDQDCIYPVGSLQKKLKQTWLVSIE